MQHPPLTTGTTLGPYQLISPLGSGGMAEVWKATDTRLNRIVAIKRLKADYKQRFQQEARVVAAFSHPNICQIHDVGPDYLVLEYVEGEPLHGPYLSDEALRLAIQIAVALEAAHQRGIIHRDLKPANILVTKEGVVKLLDFGISKYLSAADADITATVAGTILGTVHYMSPEQAQGQPVDGRSDIFSFGSVLYQMLSGRCPFDGPSISDVLRSILTNECPPLHGNPALERIVMRCLEKATAQRFQTAADLKAALTQIHQTPAPQRPSIAVLPFDNIGGDKENEYFSDGLAEEIINALVQVPQLKVIARTSAFAFKGKHEDIRRIAQTLGVDHLLEGSVRRSGNQIRVTAQLIAASDGSHRWSQRFDREWADVFAIQDEISTAIVATMRLKLAPEASPIHTRHTPLLAAYEAVLKARHDSLDYRPDAAERCRGNYESAIAIDPQFAQAHAELAIQLLMRAVPGIAPARDTMPLARAAAQRALDLDPTLPEAHAVLAAVAGLYDYNWNEAKSRFARSAAGNSVPPAVRFLHATFYLTVIGSTDEAIAEFELGLQEDPLSFGGRFQLAVCFLQARRFSEAEMELRRAMKVHPNSFQLQMFLALTYAGQGNLTEALAWAEQAHSVAPWHSHPTAVLAGLLVQTGDRQRASGLLERLNPPQSYGVPTARAFYYMLAGEVDLAAHWSRNAIDQRDPRMVLGLLQPMAQALLSQPSGKALMQLMNLESSQFGAKLASSQVP